MTNDRFAEREPHAQYAANGCAAEENIKQHKRILKNPLIPIILICLAALMFSCISGAKRNGQLQVTSPDSRLAVDFFLNETGKPAYTVHFNQASVIDTSILGFDLKDEPDLSGNFEIISLKRKTIDETWEMPWGEKRLVHNHCNELLVRLKEKDGQKRPLDIIFRVFNDGLGFRFIFPEQEGVDHFMITDENTQFNLTGDHTTFWQPGDWDCYEHLFNTSRFSEINALDEKYDNRLRFSYIPENAVNTPVTMKTDAGLYLSFHEANLTDYAGMTLKVLPDRLVMQSELVGSENTDYKVKRALPFETPWRTLQISETAGGLIESDLVVNLNEPNQLGDISWFEPTKYIGMWWQMHLGINSWDMYSGKHGATTENVKKLIDFAAENNIGAVLVEGWNTGWEKWTAGDREGIFDFVTPYPDYDLNGVVKYAKNKNVEIIMHHETSSAVTTYEQQMDTAFQLIESLDINVVKTGYAGTISPKGEYHHGQFMVNHYRKVLETAAKYKVAVNAHEPIKATGIRRTLPNAITREGLRGQEWNAWGFDGGNPPEHLSIIAFTRMLAGPIDYTPGIFHMALDSYHPGNRVKTTLAHQLALYVVINSPIQMAADLIENYQNHEAFQFIRDVAVNWEQTRVLNGEIGDFVTIARQARGTEDWFIGAITDENAREFKIYFDFLPDGKTYKARIYADRADAHWKTNPAAYEIIEKKISKDDSIDISLAPGGGVAISLLKEGK